MNPNIAYSSHYERMSGNCTQALASQMLLSLNPPMRSSAYILDNTCRSGIVSEQIKLVYPDVKIMATDWSSGMIEETQARIKREGWSKIETGIEDVRDLKGLKDRSFSHAFTNLGMPVPGDGDSGVKITSALFRILKVGGVALVYTWAARAIRSNEEPQMLMALNPEFLRGSWLAGQLEQGGFGNNIEIRPCVTYTEADSLEDLVDNMMLAKQMFFNGFDDEEMERVGPLFREELTRMRTYDEIDGRVRVVMKA